LKNFGYILWLLFDNGFKKRLKSTTLAVRAAITVLLVLGIIVLAGVCVALYFGAQPIKEIGKMAELLTLILTIADGVILVFGIVSLINHLFLSKDAEFFLALPVKSGTIYFAKIVYIYLTELIITACILVPISLVIGISASMSWYYYLAMFFAIVSTPMFPLMIASIISLPLMFVVSFFRARAVFTSIMLVLVFGIAMAAYFFAIGSIGKGGESGGGSVDESIIAIFDSISNIVYILPPLTAVAYLATGSIQTVFGIQSSTTMANLINAGVFVFGLLILILLIYLVAQIVYKRGVRSQLEGNKYISKRGLDSDESVIKALVQKEWKEILRTPGFAIQYFFPIVFAPLLVFFCSVSFKGVNMMTTQDVPLVLRAIFLLIPIILFMFISSTTLCTSAGSLFSREGEKFYYVKIFPVSIQLQIKAKLRVSFVIAIISTLLMLIVYIVITKQYLSAILSLIFALIYGYGMVCFAALFDIKQPKLKWTSIRDVSKNNKNIFIPSMIGIGFTIVVAIFIAVASFIFSAAGLGFVQIVIIICVFLYGFGILFCILTSRAIKRIAEQSVAKIEV